MKMISNALAASLATLALSAGYANTFTLVSLSGDAADGAENETYESFSIPSINESGNVAFGARFSNPEVEAAFVDVVKPLFESTCVQCHGESGIQQHNFDLTHIENVQELLLRPQRIQNIRNRINNTNNPMPPLSEPQLGAETKTQVLASLDLMIEVASRDFADMDSALLYDDGQVVAVSSLAAEAELLSSARSIIATEESGIALIGTLDQDETELVLTANADTQTVNVITSGDADPLVDFSGTLDSSRNHQIFGSLNASPGNAFSFWSRLRDGNDPDASGIWIVDTTSPVAPLNGQRLLAIGGSTANGGSLTIDFPVTASANETGESALLATLDDDDENDFNNGLAIWSLDSSSAATRVAQTGDTAPGSTDSFLSFGKPAIDSDGDIVFWASLLNDDEDEGLFAYSGGVLSALATSAAPVDVFGIDRTFSEFLDPVLSPSGDLAALAKEGDLRTIVRRTAGGAWSIIAQAGMQAPGAAAGITFANLSIPHINGNGQVAFQATLAGSGDGISDTTDGGTWAVDSNGVLALVAREGDTIDVRPDFPATIASTAIGGFNTANQLALNYQFTNGATAIAIVGVEDVPPPAISLQPASETSYDGETVTLSVEVDGQGPFEYQWKKDGVDIDGANDSQLVIDNASGANDGDYTVTVTSTAGSVQSQVASLTIEGLPDIPAFVEQPLGDIAFRGTQAVLDARAVSNTAITYQWYFEDQPIAGATGDTLSINPADTDDEGTYHVVATSAGGSTESAPSELLVTDKRLFNIAARARVGTDANVLIAGFVVIGPEPKQVLIRGIGPSLVDFGVTDPLLQPRLEIYNSSGELIHSNEGWQTNADPDEILEVGAKVGAGGTLVPDDTALVVTLEEGLYTAIVRGRNGTTGVALVETFEVEENLTRMINISSRAFVGTGADVVIPGFVVRGDVRSRVLIRAVGPSLEDQGVSGFLAHPVIRVHNAAGEVVATNDGWRNLWDPSEITEVSAQVGAFALDPDGDDAAIILELEPDLYTVVTSGENQTTGVALVEVYAVP